MQSKLQFSYITNVTQDPCDVRVTCPAFVPSSWQDGISPLLI